MEASSYELQRILDEFDIVISEDVLNETIAKKYYSEKLMSTKDLRTVFNFDSFTDEIKRDLNETMEVFFDLEKRKEINNRYITFFSKNQYFCIHNDCLHVIDLHKSTERASEDNRYSKKVLIFDDYRSIKTYNYDEMPLSSVKMINEFRIYIHDYLLSTNFTDTTKEDKDLDNTHQGYTCHYQKAKFCSTEIIDSIGDVIERYGRNIGSYVHPYDYCGFELCEDDPKYLQFSYRRRVTRIKVGKGIKKMLKIINTVINDNDLKTIANRLSGTYEGYEMVVVEGEDITKYYNGKTYADDVNTGSLANSCMRSSDCGSSHYFDIYETHAKMLIYRNEETDKIIGRAILWTAHDGNSDVLIMDRIYACEKVYLKFFDWAKENGYFRKRYQTYDNSYCFVGTDGTETDLELTLDFCLDDFDCLPYMDTFAWGDYEKTTNTEDYGNYCSRDTGGGLMGRCNDDYNDDDDDDF